MIHDLRRSSDPVGSSSAHAFVRVIGVILAQPLRMARRWRRGLVYFDPQSAIRNSQWRQWVGSVFARRAAIVAIVALAASAAGQEVPPLFPPDNAWNTPIDEAPVHPNSDAFLESIGPDQGLHPDFGTFYRNAPIGIPFVLVGDDQPEVPIKFKAYKRESDRGPYPVPPDAPIEGGPRSDGDRHVLVVDVDNLKLYEMFRAFPKRGGAKWRADSGAVWDLTSNDLRPLCWTSADAAGLAILPGLVRYDEVVEKGEINHAVRFTVERTQRGFILPATHFASDSNDPDRPPMGLRLRLRADYNISGFSPHVQVILRALKKYGMIVADNGTDWYITGTHDPRWDDDELHELGEVQGRDFEVVYTGEIIGECP